MNALITIIAIILFLVLGIIIYNGLNGMDNKKKVIIFLVEIIACLIFTITLFNISMLNLLNQIVARAKANRQRIVLPEGTEERTLKAANQILTDGVADLILLGNPDEINACATEWGLGNISKATIIDPENHPKKEEYAQLLCELRKKKGMTIEEARKLVLNPLYLGCLII